MLIFGLVASKKHHFTPVIQICLNFVVPFVKVMRAIKATFHCPNLRNRQLDQSHKETPLKVIFVEVI